MISTFLAVYLLCGRNITSGGDGNSGEMQHFKDFRVARFKRINCKVNLINLSLLLTRDTFSFPPSMQSVE